MRARGPGRDRRGKRATPRGRAAALSHRRPSRRRHRRGRRSVGRWRQYRRPATDARRAGRHLRFGRRARPDRHQAADCVYRSRRPAVEKHGAPVAHLRDRRAGKGGFGRDCGTPLPVSSCAVRCRDRDARAGRHRRGIVVALVHCAGHGPARLPAGWRPSDPGQPAAGSGGAECPGAPPPSQAARPGAPRPSPPGGGGGRAAPAPRLSIVVLPFTNLSNDPEQEYFADGITEDLTVDVSRIAGAVVIARNSAFAYKGQAADPKKIGRELGVRYILQGSVRRAGSQIRINAVLIDAETDTQIWAERFDRDIGDLFAVQNEITVRIARALQSQMAIAESRRTIAHPDALDYILRGRAQLTKPISPENYNEAIAYFESALELDPQSAEAAAWLANLLAVRALDELTPFPNDDLHAPAPPAE